MRTRLTRLVLGALGLGAAVLVWPSTVSSELPSQGGADTTIVVKALGTTLEFVPPRISVKTGTRVTLRFMNEGTLPHNVVLPRTEDDIDPLALAAYEAAASGYVPVEEKDRMLAYTALASPGQTVEVTFTVPAPGEYTYVCLFPGHANTMLGTLRALH